VVIEAAATIEIFSRTADNYSAAAVDGTTPISDTEELASN
jgi:hypothetical protein